MKTHFYEGIQLSIFSTIAFCTLMMACGSNADTAYDNLMKNAYRLSIKNSKTDTTSYDEVLLLLDSAITIIPQRTEAYTLKNGLLLTKKKFDKAINNNYRLIAQYPDNPLFRMNYGHILKLKGDSLQAQKEYQKALFLNQHALAKSKNDGEKANLALQRVELMHALNQDIESERLFNSIKDGFKENNVIKNQSYRTFIEKIEWRY